VSEVECRRLSVGEVESWKGQVQKGEELGVERVCEVRKVYRKRKDPGQIDRIQEDLKVVIRKKKE
jgi:hypothetical protein